MSEKIDVRSDYEALVKKVREYLAEVDNPAADYGYRKLLRDRLREHVGAPAEPRPHAQKGRP